MRELALEVTEERLDPGLVVGRGRSPEVLGDAGAGHEHRGGLGGHLGSVVADREQYWQPFVVVGDGSGVQLVEQLGIEQMCLRASVISASVKATSTWVEDSSAETTVDSHSRDTTSRTATAHRRLARKWVKS